MTNLTTGPAYVDASTTPVLNHVDFLCRVLLGGAATDGAFSLVEERGALGCMTPRHVHEREAETFIVLEGALEGWCEGSAQLVEAGSLLHLPANKEHAFRVASATARFYTLITPSGFEDFFPASGVPVDQLFDGELPVPGPPPPEAVGRLAEVAAGFGCRITGPPPFGPPEA
ncbi:MAG TPA: cupin domain-containing protein [Nocardioides sp.]|nr:cupin domain-containing protein [Nocardioides sp.]